MSTVTLTTDFGKNNYNIASLKGAILSSAYNSKIIEISNEIKNYDIIEGTFMVSNSYNFFPKKSIHVIAINCYYAPRVRLLLLQKDEYFFIAPDNGILSILFEDVEFENVRYLEYGKTKGDLYLNIATIIGEIKNEKPLEEIGLEVKEINRKISLKPVISGDTIRATVIFIDKFGNAILNLKQELFEQTSKGRNFELFFSPKSSINKICNKYSDVPYGDELCLFNSAGHLEIAVNMGDANQTLGLEKNSTIQVIFN